MADTETTMNDTTHQIPHNVSVLSVYGNPPRYGALGRVQSRCLLGFDLGSAECDCIDQWELAARIIEGVGSGFRLYLGKLREDGRGHGFRRKLQALAMKNKYGLDTFEAVEAVEGVDRLDLRDYSDVAPLLWVAGLQEPVLMTNNREKLAILRHQGVPCTGVPLDVDFPVHSWRNREAKRMRGHAMAEGGPATRIVGRNVVFGDDTRLR